MSNTKPDFSRDPERVALAKVLREAVRSTFRSVSVPNWETMDPEWKREYLFMADAAITHLGSGYRLPEATEANAERLAKVLARQGFPHEIWEYCTKEFRAAWMRNALKHIGDTHAAFADPAEKAEPVFLREDQMRPAEPEPDTGECSVPGCDRGFGHQSKYHTPHQRGEEVLPQAPDPLDLCSCGHQRIDHSCNRGKCDYCMNCDAFTQTLHSKPKVDDATSLSPTERGERRRDRQEKVWEMLKQIMVEPLEDGAQLVQPSALTWDAMIRDAALGVDRYLAWRDADTAKDMGAYKK